MIKVTLGEVKTQVVKPYPKLMRHADGTITYFLSQREGVHIYEPNSLGIVGKYTNCIEMEDYSDYNEPITIQNS
jgi:hypothetical protein